jgi:hypothetical protein
MKTLTALAMMAFALSFCNLSQRLSNRGNNNGAPVKSVQPPGPGFGSHYVGKMEDIFPQKVLEYPLVVTINPRNFGVSVPEGTEVRGGVYRSKKNEIVKHMLVNFVSIEESAKNLRLFLKKAQKENESLGPEAVLDNSGQQIGERFAFSDGEENLFWTNGSLLAVVKTKSRETTDKFARALPYYVELTQPK